MPSKQNTRSSEEYHIVSVTPSLGDTAVLRTTDNAKEETLLRISDGGKVNIIKRSKSTSKKVNAAVGRNKSEIRSENRKSEENDANNATSEYPSRTRAHHVLYTKTSSGTVYRKTEESTVDRRSSSRKSQTKTEQSNRGNGTDNNIRLYKQVNDIDVFDIHQNMDTREFGVQLNSLDKVNFHDHNSYTVQKVKAEDKETVTNFKEEADRLIQHYKKKYGSRDNLDDTDTGSYSETNGHGAVTNEDKIIIISNDDIKETDVDKELSKVKPKNAGANKKAACYYCGDPVYQKEKIGPIRDVLFHMLCFRCSKCGTALNLYNFYQNHKDMHDQSVYCKSHQPSSDSSKVDIADKTIQAVINKPKLGRVNSNVRGGGELKSSIGTDAVCIKSAMNAPKLGTYNPNVRVVPDTGSSDHIDHKAVFVQTAMKAPKLDVYHATVRPVPDVAQKTQPNHSKSTQRNSGYIPPSDASHHGSNAVHSLYLHQP